MQKTSLDNIFKTDVFSNEGVWTELPGSNGKIKLKIAHMGNENRKWRAYAIEMSVILGERDKLKPIKEKYFSHERAELTQAFEKRNLEVIGECILKDWKGIIYRDEEGDGKTLTYSKEYAVELLENYPSLADFVATFASNRKNFGLSEQDNLKKTSSASSSPQLNTETPAP